MRIYAPTIASDCDNHLVLARLINKNEVLLIKHFGSSKDEML